MKDDKSGKIKWDDLVMGAIEKIASAPSKLKDPKESVSQAFEWMKTLRDDLQEKMMGEITKRIQELDWDSVSKKVGEHIAENFDIEVTAKVSFKPKSAKKQRKSEPSEQD
jgi:hypothetical protein